MILKKYYFLAPSTNKKYLVFLSSSTTKRYSVSARLLYGYIYFKIHKKYNIDKKHDQKVIFENLDSLIYKLQPIPDDLLIKPITEKYFFLFGFVVYVYTDKKELEKSHKENVIYLKNNSEKTIIDYVKKEFKDYLYLQIIYYLNKLGFKRNTNTLDICVSKFESKYASVCPNKNEFRFDYRLAFYDKRYIDAVIIHECCHYIDLFHSKKFYSYVLNLCPNYYQYHDLIDKGVYNDAVYKKYFNKSK